MTRSKQLRPASFRGVPFSVDAGGVEVGRRVQVHEYPQRDKPYVEDLGRATRAFTVRALIVGDDYIQRANKLLEALEQPGAGLLVHPWLGQMQATLSRPARAEFDRQRLGVATLDLEFVESGDLAFPSVQASTQAATRLSADAVVKASVAQASRRFNVVGVSDFVQAAAESHLQGLSGSLAAALPDLPALGDVRKFAQAAGEWVELVRNPAALAASIAEALSVADYIQRAADLRAVLGGLLVLARSNPLASPPAPSVSTLSRLQAWRNQVAVNGLARQVVLAQAIGASSLVPAEVHDDVISLRNQIVAAIDEETLAASDESYQALVAARLAVWRDLTDRARGAGRLRTVRPPVPVPALVLSHRLYASAGRADEIVARNRVRHPGFVPASDLLVLST